MFSRINSPLLPKLIPSPIILHDIPILKCDNYGVKYVWKGPQAAKFLLPPLAGTRKS